MFQYIFVHFLSSISMLFLHPRPPHADPIRNVPTPPPPCSRVEWVWLHWIEYLKANEGFEAGLARLGARLDAQVELQLDAREKQWQADHLQVELSNVCGQAPLLERLLDEAEALHGSTQDPSLDPAAREALRQAYSDVRDATRVRRAVCVCPCVRVCVCVCMRLHVMQV